MCFYDSVNYMEILKSCFAVPIEVHMQLSSPLNDQTIHDLETLSLTQLPDQLQCFAMTADPSYSKENVLQKS